MDRFLLFFFRLIVIALGFLFGCLVTGAALAILSGVIAPGDVEAFSGKQNWTGIGLGILAVTGLTAYAAIIPVMFIVIFAESRRKRDWFFYCLAGGLIAVLCIGFVAVSTPPGQTPSVGFFSIVVVSGMLGGIGYWLIAGRNAGGWLPRQIKRARLERVEAGGKRDNENQRP